jgi:hypothetical protein
MSKGALIEGNGNIQCFHITDRAIAESILFQDVELYGINQFFRYPDISLIFYPDLIKLGY